MAWIGGSDHAVDLDRSLVYRDLGASRDVAAVTHMLGETAVDALRRWLAPTGALRHSIQYCKVLGMVRHQLPPKIERVLAHGMSELIYEALQIDRVLIVIYAAPEVRR